MEYIKANKYLMAVKWISAVLQAFSTANVFMDIFVVSAGYKTWQAIVLTACSILLIDGLFLTVLSILEEPDMKATDKIPWVVVAIFLLFFVLVIGFVDEEFNPLSFAPRLGLIGLVLAYISIWINQFISEHNSREAVEKRLHDEQMIKRDKARKAAEAKAWQNLQAEMEIKAEVKAYDDMNMDDMYARWYQIEMVRQGNVVPELKQSTSKIEIAPKIQEHVKVDESFEDNIIELGKGKYAWVDGYGKKHVTTSTGKPYTFRGAQIALARHYNNN